MHLDMKPPGPTGHLQGCISKLAATPATREQASSAPVVSRGTGTGAPLACALAIGASHPHCRTDIRKSLHPSALMLPSCSKTPSFVLCQHKAYA